MVTQQKRFLTPCPPSKRCAICEARLDAGVRTNTVSKAPKFAHQAAEAGRKALDMLLSNPSEAQKMLHRAFGFAELALANGYTV